MTKYNYLLLGVPNSGKSSFLGSWSEDDDYLAGWSEDEGKRKKLNLGGNEVQINMWIDRTKALGSFEKYIRNTHAVFIMVDMTREADLIALRNYKRMIELSQTTNPHIAIIATKNDLVNQVVIGPQHLHAIEPQHLHAFVEEFNDPNISLHFVNSQTGQGVDKAVENVTRKVMQNIKIKNYQAKIDKKNADTLDASADDMNTLKHLIFTICHSDWSSHIRFGSTVNGRKVPAGVRDILAILNEEAANPQHALARISQRAEHKHSIKYQWLHSFFRGRDKITNEFYNLLSQIHPLTQRSVNQAILNLEEFSKRLNPDISNQLQIM